ncbi:MAG: hypothetical protein GF364_06410 [Candidatus Lokiarchaeota archaeon]|nr:hypothetical protein [Candidatus Lokiarchaeota archaeon]
MELFNVKNGRIACAILVIVDVILGGCAVFFSEFYAAIFHPNLPASEIPTDYIIRTGVLWLVFLLFQLIATFSRRSDRWFFVVAAVRLMDVPADIVYGILARGATVFSRFLILSAPILNILFGLFLLKIVRGIEKDADSDTLRNAENGIHKESNLNNNNNLNEK